MRSHIDFQPKSLRQRALDYLGKREYSYFELAQKLKPYAEDAENNVDESTATEQIPAILDDFKKRGWLSDARFAEMLVHSRKSKFGSAKVANELREKGVADDLISEAVATVKVTELEHAREICRKKYKASPTSREDWARQARFLQSRGFGFDVIKQVLNSKNDEYNL